jgi:uncharacterized protein (TIGR02996 family)
VSATVTVVGTASPIPIARKAHREYMLDPPIDTIVASPDDDAPRLVWAQREGGERGELVVLQCALARHDLPREERRRLSARERELLARHGRAWSGLDGLAEGTFVRGFVERARVTLPILAAKGQELFERAPLLRELDVGECTPSISGFVGPRPDEAWRESASRFAEGFGRLPPDRVEALRASAVIVASFDGLDPEVSHHYGDELVELIARADSLRRLEALAIDADLSLAGLEPLGRLGSLSSVSVGANRLRAEGLCALLAKLPSVRRLAVRETTLTSAEREAFLASAEIARLTALDLSAFELTNADLERIAQTPTLSNLMHLGVTSSFQLTSGIEALARSPYLSRLVELHLRHIDTDRLGALASAPFARRLRVLRLGGVHLTREVIRDLLSFPALEQLELSVVSGKALVSELEAIIPCVRT